MRTKAHLPEARDASYRSHLNLDQAIPEAPTTLHCYVNQYFTFCLSQLQLSFLSLATPEVLFETQGLNGRVRTHAIQGASQ